MSDKFLQTARSKFVQAVLSNGSFSVPTGILEPGLSGSEPMKNYVMAAIEIADEAFLKLAETSDEFEARYKEL